MGFRSKFLESPTLSTADSPRHEPFPKYQSAARLHINPGCLIQGRICERNHRLKIKPQFRAGFHKHVVTLLRRTVSTWMNLGGRLLTDHDPGSAFDANRGFQLVASEQTRSTF